MNAPLPTLDQARIAVIGLGYVGLPLAVAFGRKFPTLGFDINATRVSELREHRDHTLEVSADELRDTPLLDFSDDPAALAGCNVFIVTVPTPIDDYKRPDLRPLESASRTVGRAIGKGGVAIFESTVYPGATEEACVPIIERESGLRFNQDFYAGYSPERINPGDKQHRLETIMKVTSGSTPEVADFVDALYGSIITAGTHKASSIRVAEAAKVIENTQRDVNIALINELALIFHRLGIDTHEVLEAAGTKWNFLPFRPGLVGGHCIGVDPYYLLHKSKQMGYDPQVILSGRRVNDGMPAFVAKRLVQLLTQKGKNLSACKVLVMGITFKENVADIRNSKVTDVIHELMEYSIHVHIHDPHASPNEVAHEYRLTLQDEISNGYDAVLVAVGHNEYKAMDAAFFAKIMKDNPILVDIKAMYKREDMEPTLTYWRL